MQLAKSPKISLVTSSHPGALPKIIYNLFFGYRTNEFNNQNILKGNDLVMIWWMDERINCFMINEIVYASSHITFERTVVNKLLFCDRDYASCFHGNLTCTLASRPFAGAWRSYASVHKSDFISKQILQIVAFCSRCLWPNIESSLGLHYLSVALFWGNLLTCVEHDLW